MKLSKAAGFSILEVMVGAIIFALGLLLLSSMMMVSFKGNRRSHNTSQTIRLIREKIEHFRNEDPAKMVSGGDNINGITRNWYFKDLATNLKELTIMISWTDERQNVYACTTSTYIHVETQL